MIDYHSVGTLDKMVISNSATNEIDPTMGGNPQKFLKFFEKTEDSTPKTASLERGDLLHQWRNNRHEFIIADITKPGDKLSTFIEALSYKLTTGNFIPPADPTNLKLTISQDALTNYEALKNKLQLEDTNKLIYLVRQAREETNYNANLKEETSVNHLLNDYAYLDFLGRAREKVIVDQPTKLILNSANDSLNNHEAAKGLLNTGETEHEIYWEYKQLKNTSVIEDFKFDCKSKLDNIEIDHKNYKVKIKDLKTTTKSTAYNFYPLNSNKSSLITISRYITPFEIYKIYKQLAFYRLAVLNSGLLSKEYINKYEFEFYLIVVQLFDEFTTCVFKIHPNWIFEGTQQLSRLFHRINWHKVNNKWDYHYEEYVSEDGFILKANESN